MKCSSPPQVIEFLRSLPDAGPFVFAGKTARGITGYTHAKKLLDTVMQSVSGGANIPNLSCTICGAPRLRTWLAGRRAARRRSYSQSQQRHNHRRRGGLQPV